MKEIKIKGYNELDLFTRVYDDVEKPKAVVQIIHGMREHSLRYDRFSKMLNKNGYIVIASDSRGHGNTAPSLDKLGHGENDIYAEVVQDQIKVSEYIKETYKLPLYIFAHSWGSMIAQTLIQVNHLADKIILCGTDYGNNGTYKLGNFITTIQTMFGLKNKPAKLIEATNKKMYASKFVRGNWLSRDEDIYDKYLADPFCNAVFPVSFYKSLFKHMIKVNKTINNIKKDLKILLIAGDNDPVGNYGKNVVKLAKLYKKKGYNSTHIIYKGARHELINEINKKEVDSDIIKFYNN